jgi:hypothetical protein
MHRAHLTRVISNCAVVTFLTFLFVSCNDSKSTSPEATLAFGRVIPKPMSAEMTGKTFLITENTTIVADASSTELRDVANYLAENLKTMTGLSPSVVSEAAEGAILLTLQGGSSSLGNEGYELQIDEK